MKIPFVSSIISFFTATSFRTYLDYILIAGFVAALGFSTSTWIQRVQLDKKVETLSGTVATNRQTIKLQAETNATQDQAIMALKLLRTTDATAIKGLQDHLEDTGKQDYAIRTKISQLEKSNAEAKAVLDYRVPLELSCVLDDTPCPGDPSTDYQNGGRAAPPGKEPPQVVRSTYSGH